MTGFAVGTRPSPFYVEEYRSVFFSHRELIPKKKTKKEKKITHVGLNEKHSFTGLLFCIGDSHNIRSVIDRLPSSSTSQQYTEEQILHVASLSIWYDQWVRMTSHEMWPPQYEVW